MFSKENYLVEEIRLETNIKKELAITFAALLVCALFFGLPFYFIWQERVYGFVNLISAHGETIFAMARFGRVFAFVLQAAAMLLVIAVLTLIHELVHGLIYGMFADSKFKAIKMGFLPKSLTAYCICQEELQMKHSKKGLLAPLLFMGIIPLILSMVIGNVVLFLLGMFTILASIGDMTIFWQFLKFPNDSWVHERISKDKELLMTVYRPMKTK